MPTEILPEPVLEQVAARDAATLAAASPRTARTVASKEAALEKAQEELAELRDGTLGAVDQILGLLRELADAEAEQGILAGIQNALDNRATLASAALKELLTFQRRNDNYALARYTTRADEISRLLAIEPALSVAIAENEAAISKLISDIRNVAAQHGVDLERLSHVQSPEIAAHVEAGRLARLSEK